MPKATAKYVDLSRKRRWALWAEECFPSPKKASGPLLCVPSDYVRLA